MALEQEMTHLPEWLKAFEERRRLMVDRLNAIEGVTCPEPQGAFYCFPDVSALYGKTVCGKKVAGSLDLSDVRFADIAEACGLSWEDQRTREREPRLRLEGRLVGRRSGDVAHVPR